MKTLLLYSLECDEFEKVSTMNILYIYVDLLIEKGFKSQARNLLSEISKESRKKTLKLTKEVVKAYHKLPSLYYKLKDYTEVIKQASLAM